MMVAVHQTGHDHMVCRTEHLVGLIPRGHLLVRTHCNDDAVALDDGAVSNHFRCRAARHFANDILPTNQGRRHSLFLCATLTGTLSPMPRATGPCDFTDRVKG